MAQIVFELDCALAMLDPVVCGKLYALFGSCVHGAGFEQHEAFVQRCMRVGPFDLLDEIATRSVPVPGGVDTAAWTVFLEQDLAPALRQARHIAHVDRLHYVVSDELESEMERLPTASQSRLKAAFAALRADSCDEIAVLAAEAALCRAMVRTCHVRWPAPSTAQPSFVSPRLHACALRSGSLTYTLLWLC